jgi:uncharacterized protein DUF3775
MAELSIDPEYLRNLIVKVRALMGREGTVMPDGASNFTDDDAPPESLQVEPSDLTREELVEELRGLSASEQAELVALMWVGREDAEIEEWDAAVERAKERRETPTESYLLDHPLLAEYWLEGLTKLGYDGLVSGVEETA